MIIIYNEGIRNLYIYIRKLWFISLTKEKKNLRKEGESVVD